MILKLSYENEIHRISNAPARLSDLYALIISAFRTKLPEQISLSYTIKGEVEDAPIHNQEQYDALLTKLSTTTAKIQIKESNAGQKLFEGVPADYDFIGNDKTRSPVEEKKDEAQDKMSMGGLIQSMSESVVVPQVQKYPFVAQPYNKDNTEENIKNVVREVLREQLPYIISQVKDAVLLELRASMAVNQAKPELPKAQNNYYEPVDIDEDKKVDLELRDSEVKFENADNVYGRDDAEVARPVIARGEEKSDLLNQMKKFGVALKEQIAVLPGKAKDAFDDLSQKLEGDPYVTLEEGKFPKSVVDKVNLLKEIFPEEDKKMLLQFVKQYPRNVTLEQLADLYLFKDEPQEQQNNQA